MAQSHTSYQDDQRHIRYDAFLSYASANKPVADAACRAIEALGVRCWIAPRDIRPAQDWSGAIIDAIADCRVFVLILSNASNLSEQVKREVQNAVSEGKPILPMRIEEVSLSKHMRYFIGTPHWLDAMTPPLEPHLQRLAETIQGLIRSQDKAQDKALGEEPTTGDVPIPPRPQALPEKAPAAIATNLPPQLTSFIGRETEVVEVKTLLNKTRLLTLTGMGGVGKTRLSLQAAAGVLDQFPDGAWLVELAPLSDPALVPQSVAQTLGVREESGKTVPQSLVEWLRPKRLLLILDNCEHLIAACAVAVTDLLRNCPDVHLLISSREPLNVAGEQTYPVPSLCLPDPRRAPTAESLARYESAALFVARAQSVRPDFVVTDKNAPIVAQVCCRLDGIPLAIELAAARARSLSVEAINDHLDNRFRLLTGGSKTTLPRQQTLRALIDWSYDLLTDQEKALLRRLSAFAGGWRLSAAEAIAAGEEVEEFEVLDLLTSLSDKSLVISEERNGTTRYRYLETMRQYARERLAETEEEALVCGRHRDHFLSLAEEIAPRLKGPEQAQWLSALEEEHDNLRRAMTFCLEEAGAEGPAKGMRLGTALLNFWETRGHLSEGRERLKSLLSHPEMRGRTQARAEGLNGAGTLARIQGDYASARSLLEEGLAIQRELGDRCGIATCLVNLGTVSSEQGDYLVARPLLEESLTIRRELGDRLGIAVCLTQLGAVFSEQGDDGLARPLYEESLAIRRGLGDRRGISICLNNLGALAFDKGDYGSAASLFGESLAIRREMGDRRGIAICLNNLGGAALEQGDSVAARPLYEESLTIRRELGDRRGIAGSLGEFAALALQEKKEQHAARLWGAAEALREAIGAPLPPSEIERYNSAMTAARGVLGTAAFATACAEGYRLTMEQAVMMAMEAASAVA